jgi:hypothetical protein
MSSGKKTKRGSTLSTRWLELAVCLALVLGIHYLLSTIQSKLIVASDSFPRVPKMA